MSIDSKTAAKIAKAHGLTLSDAQALARLAEDEKEAAELASMFSDRDTDPRELAAKVPRG